MKSLEFEKVSVAEARGALDGPAKARATIVVRRSADANPGLLDATVAWMNELPHTVRPTELARRFPRIANSIAELWGRIPRCEEYLDSMLIDQRGDRKGFSPPVAMELTALRAYYAELHPSPQSAWEPVESST
jgi:hypothetical protein